MDGFFCAVGGKVFQHKTVHHKVYQIERDSYDGNCSRDKRETKQKSSPEAAASILEQERTEGVLKRLVYFDGQP